MDFIDKKITGVANTIYHVTNNQITSRYYINFKY